MFGKNKPKADLQYFSIFDSKAQNYKDPMLAMNEHDMIRQIDNLFRDPAQRQNQLLLNAEDFTLFRVGYYDRKTGTLIPCEHESVARLHEILAVVQRSSKFPDLKPVGIETT